VRVDRLYGCVTRVREQPLEPGEITRGRRLAERVPGLFGESPVAGRVTPRRVTCPSGRPYPCIVALRGASKAGLRAGRMTCADAPAIVRPGQACVASVSGELAAGAWPERLHAGWLAFVPAGRGVR
jgi:predicted metal-binding protein